MPNYVEKEARILAQINELLNALEVTLAQMEDPSNEAIGYDAQSRAIIQMEAIVNKERKLDKLHREAHREAEYKAVEHVLQQMKLEDKIRHELDKLNDTLQSLEVCDNRLKCYFEQKKAIHEIKRIIKTAEKLEA